VLGRIRQLRVDRGGRCGIIRDVVVIVVEDDGDAPWRLLWLLRMGGRNRIKNERYDDDDDEIRRMRILLDWTYSSPYAGYLFAIMSY
jgi:hypothetical protein